MDYTRDNQTIESKQYIVVRIGNEQYGIDIGYVDNIVRMQKITRVPKVQTYFKGIINLRGEIVPVMSIRLKMGLENDEITNASRVIILKINDVGTIGIVVDEVWEVVELNEDNIETSYSGSNRTFIQGIGKNGNDLISILDIFTIIGEPEN
ncbi:MAG: chemotaxis protein CheW [Lachnospiraceae bacterium]